MEEKLLFLGQIFEAEILMNLHVMIVSASENHISSVWSVCLCVRLNACYQHNSKINYSRNTKFGIVYLYHAQILLESLYKDWRKTLCTGEHKRFLIHYGLRKEFLVIEFLHIWTALQK